jgi:SAM-dependent methyltransferase
VPAKFQDTLSQKICRTFGAGTLLVLETIPQLMPELDKHPEKIGIIKPTTIHPALLFAIETYIAMILQAFLRSIGQPEPAVAGIYQWPEQIRNSKTRSKLQSLTERIDEQVGKIISSGRFQKSQPGDDLFGELYANIYPESERKLLGEFYTPAWLAEHLLEVAGFNEAIGSGKTICVLDPACGSGTFLLATARRMMQAGLPTDCIAKCVAGFDLNPLSVLMSVANLAMTLARYKECDLPPLNIAWRDSIRNVSPSCETTMPEKDGAFDYVVGNPPWLAWDKLPQVYREKTKALWQHYGLFNLSGKDARYGGAKKELALLMIMTSADYFLKPGGRLAMVLPQTVFQTHKTGIGFRQFGGDDPVRTLKVLRVDDFSAMRVFHDVTTKTATLVLEKGKPTTYPVPYYSWQSQKHSRAFQAVPGVAEQAGSAWRIMDQNAPWPLAGVSQKSDYTAQLGANTGGANGVYWVKIISACKDNFVTVRNLAAHGKQPLPVVEAEIEADVLYPLLRWRDVDRFSAQPSTWSIIVQDPATRTGLPLEVMQTKYPKTLAYLQKFELHLRSRAAFRKYLPDAPFYSMYNISRETFAPVKVVWRRMDTRIRAAVVQPFEAHGDFSFAQDRPVIPQETCSMIAVADLDEAYYLAALLNSDAVHQRVVANSVQGGKGFGSPGMLDYLPIRRFDVANEMHMQLAQLGRAAVIGDLKLSTDCLK